MASKTYSPTRAANVDSSGAKQKLSDKEVEKLVLESEKVRKAKEQYFMKKVASVIYKLTELIKSY